MSIKIIVFVVAVKHFGFGRFGYSSMIGSIAVCQLLVKLVHINFQRYFFMPLNRMLRQIVDQ